MFDQVHHRSEIDLSRTMGGEHEEGKQNIGMAVLLLAISDLRRNDENRVSAERFLYPCTVEHRERLEWAIGMAGIANPAWFREQLAKVSPRRVQ